MRYSSRAVALACLISSVATAEPLASDRAPEDVAKPPQNARVSASGVATKVLKAGHGRERAQSNDCVTAQYTIWKRDGVLIGGSRHWSQPANQCLRVMFPGMAESVKSMAIGEQRRLWIPAKLTYDGDAEDEPTPVDVTVDFELLGIQKAPPVPVDLKTPPGSATRLASGVVLQRISRGKGTHHPAGSERMQLHFSGWTRDGKLIESSVMAGQPAVYDLLSVMRGWHDALLQMVPGDKVRLWIPAAMAFGEKPRRGQPKGDLVYDLELISIE